MGDGCMKDKYNFIVFIETLKHNCPYAVRTIEAAKKTYNLIFSDQSESDNKCYPTD